MLLAFLALAYGRDVALPFIGDDYVFLDAASRSSVRDLGSLHNQWFGWWRPISRDLHFWIAWRLFGANETAFRLVGFAIWALVLLLYRRALLRLAPSPVPDLATLGAATMALWGTPLVWISGSQDLWMLVFFLAALDAYMRQRSALAATWFALALLSKETAAILPLIAFSHTWIVERRGLRESARRVLPLGILLVAWVAIHPTLIPRFRSPAPQVAEIANRPALPILALRTGLSLVSLDLMPKPIEVTVADVALVLASAVLMAGAAAWILRRARSSPRNSDSATSRALTFGFAWMILGWLPLLSHSIGWHAYYGCVGALGGWFVLSMLLTRRPALLIGVVFAAALLRGANASSLSWDWGHVWYQTRAGSFLEAIRTELVRQHPTLPPRTRIFFGRVPNNIGLIAGQSPALRIWYRDSTLSAGFYSEYRPRPVDETGRDLFFRFDSLRVLTEIHAGEENIEASLASNPEWESDHEKLAMLFLRAGDARRAAVEFEKISGLAHRADGAVFASACWKSLGDSLRADSLERSAALRFGLSRDSVGRWVGNLIAEMPGASRP